MAQIQNRLNVQRDYISQILNQLTAEYSTLKPEMKPISMQYPGSDDDFALLEELELSLVSIMRYAKQIQTTEGVKHLNAAIAHLQLQVFANSALAQFYAEAKGQHPKIQTYLQLLDYLRLLTLKYLHMQQTMQPISA